MCRLSWSVRTVRLAGKFGRRPARLSLYSSESVPAPPTEIPARVVLLTRAGRHLAQSRRLLTWLLLAVVVFSTSVGVCLGSHQVQAAGVFAVSK